MRTQHVPWTRWRETLDDLSRTYDGAIVSLEIVGDDVGAQPEVIDQPLRGLSSDRSGVTIRIANSTGNLEHLIRHPRDLRIVETDEGAVMAVEIEENEGLHTLVHFRSPAIPELLDPTME
ncbi:MAG TPA: DUF5335 family protein [Thermoanaerobaculia bacterium]